MTQSRKRTSSGSNRWLSYPATTSAVRRVAVVLVAASSVMAFLTACSASGPSQPAPVVIVSLSANQPRATLTSALEKKFVSYAASAVDVGAAKVELVGATGAIQTIDLTPMRGSQLEQSHPEQVAARNVAELEQRLAGMATTKPGNDPLAALSIGARNAAPGSDIYQIGSGLPTVNPLDMRVIGWGVDPAELAADLSHRRLLPDLSTHHVTFVGLGDTRAPQTDLSNPVRTKLVAIWTAICHTAHAASCTTLPGDLPDIPSATSTPTPVVPVPADPSLVGAVLAKPSCSTPLVLTAATVPFAPDSPALTQAAKSSLARLAKQLIAAGCGAPGTRRIEVTGHTARIPGYGPGRALALSIARAKAVANQLVADGVPRSRFGRVNGVGDTQSVAEDVRKDGTIDPVAAALNRRVELHLN